MIKKINVVGIELDDYTVREAIMKMEVCLSTGGFDTIQEITMETLLAAQQDEKIKEALSKLTYSIISDVGILDAVGETTLQRKHEIADRDFFYEFMKRIERNHKTVFLLGEEVEKTQKVHDHIVALFPNLEIVGMEALVNCDTTVDAVVNEINVSSPDLVLSILPTPVQEYFQLEQRDKLSASIWYGLGERTLGEGKNRFLSFIKHRIGVHKLVKSISEYSKVEV